MFTTPSTDLKACTAKRYSCISITPDHSDWGSFLAAARHFQANTPGGEALITRDREPDTLVIIHDGTNIIAKSEAYHYGDDLCEMAGVHVHPSYTGQGLNKIMQGAHVILVGNRHCLFFTRPDANKTDKIIAQQTQRGWTALPANHPFYERIESTKKPLPNMPPKLCFARAGCGMDLASVNNNDGRCTPAAPATTFAPGARP